MAYFGKRLVEETSAEKLNNALQNIILQEMEDLEGILIATTNMTKSFDAAFERRFLYKVLFKDVEYVLYGNAPDLEKIHVLCKSEGIKEENSRKAIGF